MADQTAPPPRYAPAIRLPPYSYVPGHGLPHPVNDPAGHLCIGGDSTREPSIAAEVFAALPTDPNALRRGLAARLAEDSRWRYALDLFNGGFYWEAHEAWESFWHALGRTSPAAQFVQGLIHLAAAAVKVREGKPAGVGRHTRRGRELLGDQGGPGGGGHLGLAPESLFAVVAELERYTPACWHTSRTSVVRVVAEGLRLADRPSGPGMAP